VARHSSRPAIRHSNPSIEEWLIEMIGLAGASLVRDVVEAWQGGYVVVAVRTWDQADIVWKTVLRRLEACGGEPPRDFACRRKSMQFWFPNRGVLAIVSTSAHSRLQGVAATRIHADPSAQERWLAEASLSLAKRGGELVVLPVLP
jgi:hypothetical protein